eukprot:scaffold3342_cov181-Pinguiococcus_pyrenoidosus.AAC.1
MPKRPARIQTLNSRHRLRTRRLKTSGFGRGREQKRKERRRFGDWPARTGGLRRASERPKSGVLSTLDYESVV